MPRGRFAGRVHFMPELAEVEYYKRQWEPALGSKILEVQIQHGHRVFRGSDTHSLASHLPGETFRDAHSHGKQMLFRFGEDGWLGVHLGMAGKLIRHARAEHVTHKHDQLTLFTSRDALVFRDTRTFGRIRWEMSPAYPQWWCNLPPELLSDGFAREDLKRTLNRHPRSPLKSLLLDQRYFPGIGNWMADEILWRAAIHPEAASRDLSEDQIKALFRRIREVCRDALRVIAPDWSPPPSSWLFPHRWKDGGTCPKTGQPLKRIPVGGRTTCYSPARQKHPPA